MTTTPQTNTNLNEIAEVIRAHDDFVLCGHVSPDGDCFGCQMTLYHALRLMGKRCVCVLVRNEPVPASLSFMPGMEDMVVAAEYDGPCEVFMGLDVPNRERIGDAAALLDRSETSITIDHHASETTMCEYVYVDPDSASASMIVWQLVKMLVSEPPVECAICAYTGLITDTGGFRFQNSDTNAFKVAAELVSYDINPAGIAAQAFQNRSIPSLKLESLAIERMSLVADGQAAISWISLADLEEHQATKADTEPLIDMVRSVAGVRVACMLREQEGSIRGSLRSKDDTDVSALARKLNGGGHRAAAGFTLFSSLDEAKDIMRAKLADLVAR